MFSIDLKWMMPLISPGDYPLNADGSGKEQPRSAIEELFEKPVLPRSRAPGFPGGKKKTT